MPVKIIVLTILSVKAILGNTLTSVSTKYCNIPHITHQVRKKILKRDLDKVDVDKPIGF